MRYCITGAAGNISKLLVPFLLTSGNSVVVIGRNETHLKSLRALGAETLVGSIEDPEFLCNAFRAADAVYTMCPSAFGNPGGIVEYCDRIGYYYREAIENSHVKFVVNLSSMGAQLTQGAGHILSMNKVEKHLNQLKNASVKHLRPGFFYTNLLGQIDMIRQVGIMGGSFEFRDKNFPIVDPSDIAAVAAKELTSLNFSGHSSIYVASDETDTNEIASVIGHAIGKPGLKWVKFDEAQVFESMKSVGFSEQSTKEFIEGFKAFEKGKITEEYWNRPTTLGKVKIEDFADRFAEIYFNNKPEQKSNEVRVSI